MNVSQQHDVAANVENVRRAIEDAARRTGRDPAGITLIAVTKTQPPALVRQAAASGIEDFGENYVQELEEKRPAAPEARWHFIGTLQGRTAPRVAELAVVVHSAVPGHAVERLARAAAAAGRVVPVLLQIDEAGRESGVRAEDASGAIEELNALEGVTPIGLMTLPPPPKEPEDSRPYFARLRELRDDLRKRFPVVRELSMGMSLDYEIAVEEGASMVRVGTALFGPRPVRPSD